MTTQTPLPPTEIFNGTGTVYSSGGCLITRPSQQQVLTGNRETDARTALKRGLKNYLESLSFTAFGGREVSFNKVFDVWADHEEKAVFPSAIVHSVGEGTYDAAGLTPSIDSKCVTNDGAFLVKWAEYALNLRLEIWANDPEERIALMMMLEDALNPVDWMAGAKIELPHYHNQFAIYELKSSLFPDSETNVLSRTRLAYLTVTGQVSVVRCTSLPLLSEVQTTTTVLDAADC